MKLKQTNICKRSFFNIVDRRSRRTSILIMRLALVLCFLFCLDATYAQAVSCIIEADVVLVVDRSQSVSDYQAMKDFVKFMADALELSTTGDGYRLGVVTYADNARVDINLQPAAGFGIDSFKAEVDADMGDASGGTNIADGLRKAKDVLTTLPGARTDVQRIVILLNDGVASTEIGNIPTEKAALEALNAKIFAIGITTAVGPPGMSVSQELLSIASIPTEQFYKWIPRFEDLNDASFLDSFIVLFCQNTDTTQEIPVSQCTGSKTVFGHIILPEMYADRGTPIYSASDHNPPISVLGDGTLKTTPNIGDLLKDADETLTISVSAAFEDQPTATFNIIINVLQDICDEPITRMDCETFPTAVEQNACDARPDTSILRIPHPNDPRWFIFCDSTPQGYCQRCASDLHYSTECKHCVAEADMGDLEKCSDLPEPITPQVCDFPTRCPGDCTAGEYSAHPDTDIAYCQCQGAGHDHGGCHLCPIPLIWKNHCCDWP